MGRLKAGIIKDQSNDHDPLVGVQVQRIFKGVCLPEKIRLSFALTQIKFLFSSILDLDGELSLYPIENLNLILMVPNWLASW